MVRQVRYNVMQFQSGLLHRDAEMRVSGKHELHLRYRPLNRVGVYCPGGSAAYPSTLLMTVCPCRTPRGSRQIVVCMPPNQTGANNRDMLAVCHELGVREVYRLGGAQAIASMAYGVEGMEPVEMIVGPGNQYVALGEAACVRAGGDRLPGRAERNRGAGRRFGSPGLRGPRPDRPGRTLARRLDPGDVVRAADRRGAGRARKAAWRSLVAGRPRPRQPRTLRKRCSYSPRSKQAAIDCVNELAPEHLHIQTRDPDAFLEEVESAGAVFLGPFTPVAVGDYAAGPSHVLPTGGTARFSSGLNANDFRKRTSVLRFTRNGLKEIAEDVIFLANKEGLTGHAASVELRANDNGPAARPKPKPEKVALPRQCRAKK